ncbi:hypothetical protein DFQ30_002051, partial [Apophysomyces sp. BC1015]
MPARGTAGYFEDVGVKRRHSNGTIGEIPYSTVRSVAMEGVVANPKDTWTRGAARVSMCASAAPARPRRTSLEFR